MPRREHLARLALVFILAGLPLLLLGYQYGLRPLLASTRVIDIAAVAPEAGGFRPAAIRVETGEIVTLRFAAQDVTHGIAIGPGLGVDLGAVDPGEVRDVRLTFDEPGTYTYYCTTWCSPDHWRMRGVIEVRGSGALPVVQSDPVIETLQREGVDIDAARKPYEPLAGLRPSPERGATISGNLTVPDVLYDESWRRSHTPAAAIGRLAALNPQTPLESLADVVASLWLSESQNADAGRLYRQNCAACHGETGDGAGPAAELTAEVPTAFADPAAMFALRSDILYAKIRRGGMGTDMPNFGTLFTRDTTWALVSLISMKHFKAGSI